MDPNSKYAHGSLSLVRKPQLLLYHMYFLTTVVTIVSYIVSCHFSCPKPGCALAGSTGASNWRTPLSPTARELQSRSTA